MTSLKYLLLLVLALPAGPALAARAGDADASRQEDGLLEHILDRVAAPANGGAAVTLYQGEGFRGKSQSFTRDVPDLTHSHIGNNTTSSVRVAPGCSVRLFTAPDYRGPTLTLNRDAISLRGTAVGDNELSSLRVDCEGGPRGPAGGQRGVIIYSKPNFEGQNAVFYGDHADLRRSPLQGGVFGSARVPRGCLLRIFGMPEFHGNHGRLDQDQANLRVYLTNQPLMSLKVSCEEGAGYWGEPSRPEGPAPRGVTLYAERDFRGRNETFDRSVTDLRGTRIGSDQASSVRVGAGCTVRLYRGPGYREPVTEISQDFPDLRNTRVSENEVSSLEVWCGKGGHPPRGPAVTVYSDAGFGGRSDAFDGDVPDLRGSNVGDNAISSLRVPRDCVVQLYEHPNYRGERGEFHRDVPSLGDTGFGGDRASSLRIRCF